MAAIWWIRRDLRLTDNFALQAALEAGSVIPTFILDPAFSHSSSRRKSFLFAGLQALDVDLRARKSFLVIRSGKPIEALRQLIHETDATEIFAEEDFTPYTRKRDNEITRAVPLKLTQGQTVQHPAAVLKTDGKPYRIFTPYSKIWKSRLPASLELLPAPETINTPVGVKTESIPTFESTPLFPAGEKEALVRLEEFLHQRIHSYAASVAALFYYLTTFF